MSTGVPPAPRLRPRSANTIPGSVLRTKSVQSVSQKAEKKSTRVAATTSTKGRPLGVTTTTTTTTTSSSSVTNRTTRAVKDVAPAKSLDDVVGISGPQACGRTLAEPSTSSAPTSRLGHGRKPPSWTAVESQRSGAFAGFSDDAAVLVSPVASHNNGTSRLGAPCSKVRGPVDKNSAYLRHRPPVVPRVGESLSSVPVVRSTMMGTSAIRRTSSAATVVATPSAPGSQLCSRAPSVHERVISSSPLRNSRRTRQCASAPTSRLNSVNSRLADETTRPARQLLQRPRTSSVHLIMPKPSQRACTSTDRAASASTAIPTSAAETATMSAAIALPMTLGAPQHHMGVRPLLEKNVSSTCNDVKASVVSCQPPPQPSSQVELGVKRETSRVCGINSSRGNSFRVSCTSASGMAPQALLRGQQQQQRTSSARRATVSSTQKKATRKVGINGVAAAIMSSPPLPSQQRDTEVLVLSSFADYMKTCDSLVVPKGPISPIKRTATALPSAAQRHSVALSDKPARLSDEVATPIRDVAFASPWMKSFTSSTPTNGGCGRDASEAPTIPYEGSTGPRVSMSMSPRTDFDAFSVSGRLSGGTCAELAHEWVGGR